MGSFFRIALVRILACLAAAIALHAQTPKTVSVRIHLVDALTHAPIPNVQVDAVNTGKPITSRSDSNGYSLIENLIPGAWTFRTQRAPGYLTQTQTIDLAENENRRDLELSIDRAAVISGRVLTHDRQPAKSAVVAIQSDSYRGGRVVATTPHSVRTNEKGEFRVPNMLPGRYYIRVELASVRITAADENEAENLPENPGVVTDIRTYYANSDSRSGASAIELGKNEIREGLDIVVLQRKTYCMTAPLEDDVLSISLSIAESEPSGFSLMAMGGAGLVHYIKACGLPPGEYRLTASEPYNRRQTARSFTITDRGVRLSRLDLAPLLTAAGTARVVGSAAASAPAAKIFLSMDPYNRVAAGTEQIGASIDLPGSFRLEKVVPQPYWLSVSKLPPGYYLESIEAGGKDVYREPFTPGGEPLEILIGTNAPSVDGIVKDADFKPLRGATVVLVKTPLPARPAPTDVLITSSDRQGNFRFDSFAPGDYTLFALTTATGNEQDPEFVRSKLSGAAPVKLSPNGIAHVQLTAHAP